MRESLGVDPNGVETRLHSKEGELVIERVQDVKGILDANKAAQAAGHNPKAAMRHAASIPPVVFEAWMKEFKQRHKKNYFAAPKSAQEAFMKEKLNDPDNKFMRTWQGKL